MEIELVPYGPQHIRALIEGRDAYEKSFGIPAAEGLRDFVDSGEASPAFMAKLVAAPTADPWMHGFAVVHTADRVAIGSAGFKGPPDADATGGRSGSSHAWKSSETLLKNTC